MKPSSCPCSQISVHAHGVRMIKLAMLFVLMSLIRCWPCYLATVQSRQVVSAGNHCTLLPLGHCVQTIMLVSCMAIDRLDWKTPRRGTPDGCEWDVSQHSLHPDVKHHLGKCEIWCKAVYATHAQNTGNKVDKKFEVVDCNCLARSDFYMGHGV